MRRIPNALTILRLMMSVPLAVWLWRDQVGAALILLAFAALTDLMDGYLAREYMWRTKLGSWLDPAADKAMITTVLVTLAIKGEIPYWFFWITFGRDLLLVGGVLTMVLRGYKIEIKPLLTGKLATGGQNVCLLMAIFSLQWDLGEGSSFFFLISSSLTLISAYAYTREAFRLVARQA